MGCLSKESNSQASSFEIFALIPAFLGILSMVVLNGLLTRKTILESPTESLQSTRPRRIMVFVCIVGSLASVAMAVLLGLLRYVPGGSSSLASSITSSSLCLLARYQSHLTNIYNNNVATLLYSLEDHSVTPIK